MSCPTKKIDEIKYAEFFAALAPKWFSFLEWLIITGLILYLRSITKFWYFDVLGLLSSAILFFYIYAVVILSPLRPRLLKIFPSKDSLILIIISIILSAFCYFVLVYIISEIAVSYVR